MNIVLVSPEAVPYSKTGGLADVVGAIYKGIGGTGHDVSMFLPCFRGIKEEFKLTKIRKGCKISLGDRTYYFDVYSHERAYFISNEYFFNRNGFYGDSRGDFLDNAERFAFFCKAVLNSIEGLNLAPDIIHLNDWQCGLIPFYQKELGVMPIDIKTILTIHNIGYQGLFPPDVLPRIGVPSGFFSIEGLEFYGNVSLLKAGILYADQITTVSPNHQKEITTTELGYGLGDLLRRKNIRGILNGIDMELWDPRKDRAIKKNFDQKSQNGKSDCKRDLLKLFGLRNSDVPLVGIIGRFSLQKGYDIIAESLDDIMKLGTNAVILGKGDLKLENSLRTVASAYPANIGLRIGFDDQLARRIYAGSDMFLMPSRYEPCGVAQMIAMRYGTVPIVRMTGGLVDTVQDYNTANLLGNGFVFAHADRYSMLECIKRALCVFMNKKEWSVIVTNAMTAQFPWKKSIEQYVGLYSSLTSER